MSEDTREYKRISELPSSGPLVGNEIFPIVQDGDTVKMLLSDLAIKIGSGDKLSIINRLSEYKNDEDAKRDVIENLGLDVIDAGVF